MSSFFSGARFLETQIQVDSLSGTTSPAAPWKGDRGQGHQANLWQIFQRRNVIKPSSTGLKPRRMPRVSIGDEEDDAFRPQFSNSFKICCNFQKTIYWSTILCTANSPLTTLLLLRSLLFWQKKYLYLAPFCASNPGCDLRSQLLKKLLLHSIVIIFYCNHILL